MLGEEDESDGLGEFDENMEIFAPEGTEGIEVPPWWKANIALDILLACVESIRYA